MDEDSKVITGTIVPMIPVFKKSLLLEADTNQKYENVLQSNDVYRLLRESECRYE